MSQAGPRIGVGIVGIGFGRAVHLPALRADPRCEVTAICASQPARAERIAAECGVPRSYGDWRAMIACPAVDAVTIAVPPALQPEVALAALAAGKPVFCEKPLAHSLEAAQQMASAAQASGLANLVDFEFPVTPQWNAARRLLHDGRIGPLRHVHVAWHVETYAIRHRLASWKTDVAGGGMLAAFVSHCLHYLEWFAGPLVRLSAHLHRQPDDPGSAETLAQLHLLFESGAAGSISASCNAPAGSGHRVEFYGEQGAIVLENSGRDYLTGFDLRCVTRDGERVPLPESEPISPQPGASYDGRVQAVAVLMRRFTDWIVDGAAAQPDFRDGLRVQTLIDAARRSQQCGEWVSV